LISDCKKAAQGYLKLDKAVELREQVQVSFIFRGMERSIQGTKGDTGTDRETRVHYQDEENSEE